MEREACDSLTTPPSAPAHQTRVPTSDLLSSATPRYSRHREQLRLGNRNSIIRLKTGQPTRTHLAASMSSFNFPLPRSRRTTSSRPVNRAAVRFASRYHTTSSPIWLADAKPNSSTAIGSNSRFHTPSENLRNSPTTPLLTTLGKVLRLLLDDHEGLQERAPTRPAEPDASARSDE